MDEKVSLAAVSKLKQGDLQRVLEERGWNQSDMARELGVRPDVVGDLINMQRVPRLTERQIGLIVQWTGKFPEDLLPSWLPAAIDAAGGRRRVQYRDIDRLQLQQWSSSVARTLSESTEAQIENIDSSAILRFALQSLTDRERRALTLRYCDDMSLEQVGRALGGVTRTRAMQIINGAIRRARRVMERHAPNGEDPVAVEHKRTEMRRAAARLAARQRAKGLADDIREALREVKHYFEMRGE